MAALALLILPVLASAQAPVKFMVLGDTRGTGTADQINEPIVTELTSEIVAQAPAFVLVPGDLVYSGTLAAFQRWKQLMGPVYTAGIKVFPVMGNHDANDPVDWATVFGADLPNNEPAGELNRTYAFTYGNMLVLGLDTYVNVGRVNQAWIDSMLANNTLPHVFAFGHMPAFKANHTDCLDDYPTQRDSFWNSLKNAKGRVYFCGHDHFYDHMRVDDRDGNLDNDVHQLIVGGGGAPLTGGYAYDGANTLWSPVGVYHDMQYGYAVVEVNDLVVTITYYHRTGANTYVATSEVWSYSVSTVPTPPPSPSGLTATPGDTKVTLKWNASAGATSYNVKRTTGTPSGTYSTIATGVTLTTYTDTAVANGTSYYYVVTAVNAVGESGSSAYVGATPQAPASRPEAPATLTATSPKRGQVKLSWTAASGAMTYNVKRATAIGGPYTLIKSGITSTAYTDPKATSRATLYYAVSGVNSVGEGPGATVVVTVK